MKYKAALYDGRLQRADHCSRCQQVGDGAIHGHHENYFYPLDVVWLCKPCHAERHRELKLLHADD